MKTIILTTALLATVAMPAKAENTPKLEDFLTKQYASCVDNSGGVTSSILDCMGEEYGRQGNVMNANYQALIKAYGAKSDFASKLQTAQRLWASMVEGEAAMMGHPEGGSSQAFNIHGVSQKAVVLRVQEFRELLTVKNHGINSESLRLNWSSQQRQCSVRRTESRTVCDARSLSLVRKTLDTSSAKLINAAKEAGYSDYLRRYAAGTRAWSAYTAANCDVLVDGKIYSNTFACLEDEARHRNVRVMDAIKLLTTPV